MVGFSQFCLLPHLQTSLRSITWNSRKVDKEVTALTTRNGISLDCPTNKALSKKKKKSHWIMLVWSILKSLFPATIFASESEDIIAVVSYSNGISALQSCCSRLLGFPVPFFFLPHALCLFNLMIQIL